MKNKKLKFVRSKLDKLDLKILGLIKKRTSLVNQVIKIKKFKNQIVDNKRIIEVLKKIRLNSIKKKIDPKITQKIWKSMISSYIEYEKNKFKKK
jgi:chorismate mutase